MDEKAVSKEQQIGFHQGALRTLVNERNELTRMITIVEQLMGMHVKGLKELGVEIKTTQGAAGQGQQAQQK